MQKTFKAIRNGDIDTVKAILAAHPEEINAVAKQPPKKDDGQSLLQVALKTGHLDIADYLLDQNVNVNYMEPTECCNEWRMPVLHDAIRCAIMNCRWNSRDYITKEFLVHSTADNATKAYNILVRMLELGADITAKDSYGNSVLERAILDARQILPIYNYTTKEVNDNRMVTDELRADLNRIFSLLLSRGASLQWIDRVTGKTIAELYAEEPVAEFFTIRNQTEKKDSFWKKLFRG